MNLGKKLGIVLLSTILIGLPIVPVSAQATPTTNQDSQFALQRGYRTGYSDGYMAGYRDTIDGLARSYTRHEDYIKANRAYSKDYGSLEDFRDGYQQGFESGYDTGFERRSFEANLPNGVKRRGTTVASTPNLATDTTTTDNTQTTNGAVTVGGPPIATATTTTETQAQNPAFSAATYLIPRDTELILELQEDLSTERSREGDKFTAKVVSPSEIAGATIEGRIAKITSPGRLKRRSELALSFNRIILNDTRWSNFSAQLIEVMPVKGDNVKRVDNEGTAVGKSSIKGDAIKVGAATGTGAVIGGVVGGPVGVAVGAGMGAAFGVGAVVIERGKHVRLGRNQQVRIKTGYETQIR
ncbi:MAG: hypothetical protein WBD16_07760 [Pyrinomonadaceae bacterium]